MKLSSCSCVSRRHYVTDVTVSFRASRIYKPSALATRDGQEPLWLGQPQVRRQVQLLSAEEVPIGYSLFLKFSMAV